MLPHVASDLARRRDRRMDIDVGQARFDGLDQASNIARRDSLRRDVEHVGRLDHANELPGAWRRTGRRPFGAVAKVGAKEDGDATGGVVGPDVDVRLLDVALQVAVTDIVGYGIADDPKCRLPRAEVMTVGSSCAPESRNWNSLC